MTCGPQLEDGKLCFVLCLCGIDRQGLASRCVDFSPVPRGLQIALSVNLLLAVASESQSHSFAKQLLGDSPRSLQTGNSVV